MLQQLVRFETQFDILQFLVGYESYWGYEFHPNELRKPYRLGGWLPSVYVGVDTSFLWFDDSTEDRATLNACSFHALEKPLKKSVLRSNIPYRGPIEYIFGPNLELGGNEKIYGYKQTFGSIACMFTGFRSLGSLPKAYELLYKKRRESYLTSLGIIDLRTESQVYKDFTMAFQYIDFLPKDSYCTSRDLQSYESEYVMPPLYNNINRYLSYMAYMNPDNEKLLNVVPHPVPPSIDVTGKSLTAQEREFSRRIVVGIGGTFSTLPSTVYSLPSSYDFSSCGWIYPDRVVQAYKANYFLPQMPLLPWEYPKKEEVIKFRCSTMNGFLVNSPFVYLFTRLVKKLTFKFMNQASLMDDSAYTEHIQVAMKELRRGHGNNPYTIPLPMPTEEEDFFFMGDLFNEIRAYIHASYDHVENLLSRASSPVSNGDNEEDPHLFWDNFVERRIGSDYAPSTPKSIHSHRLSPDGMKYVSSNDGSWSESSQEIITYTRQIDSGDESFDDEDENFS
jgi:hypothetical protein